MDVKYQSVSSIKTILSEGNDENLHNFDSDFPHQTYLIVFYRITIPKCLLRFSVLLGKTPLPGMCHG